jgi:8-oxo-dGTP diphosphatase
MEEKILLNATLCFLMRGNEVLLATKTKKIGKGCRNGYGGGIEQGESERDAAVRELFEETEGVRANPHTLKKIACVDFHNTKSDGETFVCRVHAYQVNDWEGEVHETDEMADPRWFPVSNLPLSEMMPADRDWLPYALQGKKVIATAYLGPFQQEKLKETELYFVENFLE